MNYSSKFYQARRIPPSLRTNQTLPSFSVSGPNNLTMAPLQMPVPKPLPISILIDKPTSTSFLDMDTISKSRLRHTNPHPMNAHLTNPHPNGIRTFSRFPLKRGTQTGFSEFRNTTNAGDSKFNQTNLGPMIKTGKAGSGTYGIVYIAETVKDHQPFVVKRNIIDKTTSFIGSVRELDLLSRLKGHPFVVELKSISFGNPFTNQHLSPIEEDGLREDVIYFMFEKAATDLYSLIHNSLTHPSYLAPRTRTSRYNRSIIPQGPILSYHTFKLAMVQLLLSVEFIHGKGLIHRDIKTANLLWFPKEKDGDSKVSANKDGPTLKLCDFGLSKVYTKQGLQTPNIVTAWYRAPEIFFHEPHYTQKSDMWSVGCVLFEMVAKREFLKNSKTEEMNIIEAILALLPQPTSKNALLMMTRNIDLPQKVIAAATHTNPRLSFEHQIKLTGRLVEEFNKTPGTYSEFIDLLNHLLVLNPNDRFSATEALSHPFFSEFESLILETRTLHPPTFDANEPITIVACQEREWVISVLFTIFSKNQSIAWYSHRLIFQALDIFDRYLAFRSTNLPELTFSQREIELKFFSCLYLSLKYFSTMYNPSSFEDMIDDYYKICKRDRRSGYSCNEIRMRAFETFESFLLKEVLDLKVYRATIFEAADEFNHYLNDKSVSDMLHFYSSLPSSNDLNPRELYKMYLQSQGQTTSPISRVKTTPNTRITGVYNDTLTGKVLTYQFGIGHGPGSARLNIVKRLDYYNEKPIAMVPTVSTIDKKSDEQDTSGSTESTESDDTSSELASPPPIRSPGDDRNTTVGSKSPVEKSSTSIQKIPASLTPASPPPVPSLKTSPAKPPTPPVKVPSPPAKPPTPPVKVPTPPVKVPTPPVKVPTLPAKVPTLPAKVPTPPVKVPSPKVTT